MARQNYTMIKLTDIPDVQVFLLYKLNKLNLSLLGLDGLGLFESDH